MNSIEDNVMQFPQRSAKFEWNLNSVLNIITLASVVGGFVWVSANRSRDIDELQAWQKESVEINRSLEDRVGKVESQVSSLGYRVTMGEQSNASTTASIKEVQTTLNQQSGDLKVVREILQRIEASQKGHAQ